MLEWCSCASSVDLSCPPELGDVAQGLDPPHPGPLHVVKRRRRAPDVAHLAPHQDPGLRGEGLSLPPDPRVPALQRFLVIVEHVDQDPPARTVEGERVGEVPLVQDLPLRGPRHLLDGTVPGDHRSLPVHHEGGVRQEFQDVRDPAVGVHGLLLGPPALDDVRLQRLIGRAQLLGAPAHSIFQHRQLQFRLPGELPLRRQRLRQLADLHGVERLFQDQEPVTHLQPLQHLLPAVIGISRADHDLQPGVRGPEPFDGLHAVPAGRHAHVDERHGVGAIVFQRGAQLRQSLLSLVGGVHLEARRGRLRLGAEQRHLHLVQLVCRRPVHQDLAEILMYGGGIVDQQDAPVLDLAHGPPPAAAHPDAPATHPPGTRLWADGNCARCVTCKLLNIAFISLW